MQRTLEDLRRGWPGSSDLPWELCKLPATLKHEAELLLLLEGLDVDASRLVLYEGDRCAAPSVRSFDERCTMARPQRQMTLSPIDRREQTFGCQNHLLVRVDLLLTLNGLHQ